MENSNIKRKSKKKYIVIISIVVIIILLISMWIYFNNYYKAEPLVDKYLKSHDEIIVNKISEGYFFDSKANDNAIIFYPGAKVEAISYAPLMFKLASQGVDCFLIKMPFNFAFFDQNAATKIIKKYKYNNYYLSGHSLGGVVAANYIHKNKAKISGLILLASYSTQKINNNIKILSIYGNKDTVLNKTKYEQNKINWNSTAQELIINGGNHANFGNYGFQKKDSASEISKEMQQEQTIEAIIKMINE